MIQSRAKTESRAVANPDLGKSPAYRSKGSTCGERGELRNAWCQLARCRAFGRRKSLKRRVVEKKGIFSIMTGMGSKGEEYVRGGIGGGNRRVSRESAKIN